MANNNRFTSTHSKLCINLDYVIWAESQGHVGSDVKVKLVDGSIIILKDNDATRFLATWRNDEEKYGK